MNAAGTAGSCCVCGKYCDPKDQIIVRPCYHVFHMVCYSSVIGSGESVMYCPVGGCHIGRPPFCGGCYNPIHYDEVDTTVTLPCGHRFHQACYCAKVNPIEREFGVCPSARCVAPVHRVSEEKRTIAESKEDENGQAGSSTEGQTAKRMRVCTDNACA